MMASKEPEKVSGVYKYPKGSGVYWIHYYDHGQRHHKRVGDGLALRRRRLRSAARRSARENTARICAGARYCSMTC